MSAITSWDVNGHVITDLFKKIGNSVNTVIKKFRYTFFFVSYIFVIRRAYKSPIRTFVIKNNSELVIYMVFVKSLCK